MPTAKEQQEDILEGMQEEFKMIRGLRKVFLWSAGIIAAAGISGFIWIGGIANQVAENTKAREDTRLLLIQVTEMNVKLDILISGVSEMKPLVYSTAKEQNIRGPKVQESWELRHKHQ
jgi:hypothetical protein